MAFGDDEQDDRDGGISAGQLDLPAFRRRFAPSLVGSHPSLEEALEVARRVADTDATVLVVGESGTGKELFARAIHDAGSRASGAYVTMNCGAVAETLLESELFGHVRGAFTGAVTGRVGRFGLADGGTIFLDEVGEMSAALQVRLLRVLQEREITPVGDVRSVNVDVRVIAATHRDLRAMVASSTFRADLYYRLNVVQLSLPTLRRRISDLPALVERFIDDQNRRHKRQVTGVTKTAMDRMLAFDWPGNVRELQNAVERMVVLRGRGEITAGDLPVHLREQAAVPQDAEAPLTVLPEAGIDLREVVDRYEHGLIRQALERTGWNKNRAATLLNLNRTTLIDKLKKRGLIQGDE